MQKKGDIGFDVPRAATLMRRARQSELLELRLEDLLYPVFEDEVGAAPIGATDGEHERLAVRRYPHVKEFEKIMRMLLKPKGKRGSS